MTRNVGWIALLAERTVLEITLLIPFTQISTAVKQSMLPNTVLIRLGAPPLRCCLKSVVRTVRQLVVGQARGLTTLIFARLTLLRPVVVPTPVLPFSRTGASRLLRVN